MKIIFSAFIVIGCTACGCAIDAGSKDSGKAFLHQAGDVAPDPRSAEVDLTYARQDMMHWCWATVAQMILSHDGQDVPECELVNATIRAYSPDRFSGANKGTDCCAEEPAAICDMGGDTTRPLHLYGVDAGWISRRLTEDELQGNLSNGRPVTLEILGPGTDHIMLVKGYAVDHGVATYQIYDPWPVYGGRISATYGELTGHIPTYDDGVRWQDTMLVSK